MLNEVSKSEGNHHSAASLSEVQNHPQKKKGHAQEEHVKRTSQQPTKHCENNKPVSPDMHWRRRA